ncbi:nucleotide-diphospho-sugar transferase [Russula compacta]|nr:nucleotide-diphospho-sugar transferase [Russula compacta]
MSALYSDLFVIPVATLGYSLQSASTAARRVLFYIPEHLSARALCIVELIPPPNNGQGIGHRFVDQYTKLHRWSLDELLGVHCVVYLDADTLVRRNFDDLFDLHFPFGAVPDIMRAHIADARRPPEEAEQAFLNVYFGADAVRLPYVYNANLAIRERSAALWDAMVDEMRVVHYTDPKPFPKDGKDIVEGLRLERAIEKAKRHRGGVHAQAIGWWMDAYNEFQDTESIRAGAVRPLAMRARRKRTTHYISLEFTVMLG